MESILLNQEYKNYNLNCYLKNGNKMHILLSLPSLSRKQAFESMVNYPKYIYKLKMESILLNLEYKKYNLNCY